MHRVRSWRDRQPGAGAPWIIAHRGASALAAENSREAFEAAIAAGADAIETDVRTTRDGTFVCYHDADLGRLSRKVHTIEELDFAELNRVSCVPLVPLDLVLEQVLDRCLLLLDVKFASLEHTRQLGTRLAPHAASGRICLGLRSLGAQEAVSHVAPGIPQLGFLADPGEFPEFRAAGGTWARLWERDADPRAIAALQRLKMPVAIMVGTETEDGAGRAASSTLRALLSARVDALLLNDPTALRFLNAEIPSSGA